MRKNSTNELGFFLVVAAPVVVATLVVVVATSVVVVLRVFCWQFPCFIDSTLTLRGVREVRTRARVRNK